MNFCFPSGNTSTRFLNHFFRNRLVIPNFNGKIELTINQLTVDQNSFFLYNLDFKRMFMSEYQYYEFQAIDRDLTDKEISELRAFSTRADITPNSFVNEYAWGNFKGDEDLWIEKYFDAAEKVERQRLNRLAREKRLNEITGRESILWNQIESFASEKKLRVMIKP